MVCLSLYFTNINIVRNHWVIESHQLTLCFEQKHDKSELLSDIEKYCSRSKDEQTDSLHKLLGEQFSVSLIHIINVFAYKICWYHWIKVSVMAINPFIQMRCLICPILSLLGIYSTHIIDLCETRRTMCVFNPQLTGSRKVTLKLISTILVVAFSFLSCHSRPFSQNYSFSFWNFSVLCVLVSYSLKHNS